MIPADAGISAARRATLLVVNTIGLLLLFPALGFIDYLNRDGVWQIFTVCEVGMLIASAVAWPRIKTATRARAMVTAAVATYVPATAGWAIAVHGAFFEGVPSPHQLWSLARSATLVGGLFTGLYWLPLAIVNFVVLCRPARAPERVAVPDARESGGPLPGEA